MLYDFSTLRGVNVSALSKNVPSIRTKKGKEYVLEYPKFSETFNPFGAVPNKAAFAWLKKEGFNSMRLMVFWEGIQPNGPGEICETYLLTLADFIREAHRSGIVTILDFHQDLFSRRLGGSGAPEWAVEHLMGSLPKSPFHNSRLWGYRPIIDWRQYYIWNKFLCTSAGEDMRAMYRNMVDRTITHLYTKGNVPSSAIAGIDLFNEPALPQMFALIWLAPLLSLLSLTLKYSEAPWASFLDRIGFGDFPQLNFFKSIWLLRLLIFVIHILFMRRRVLDSREHLSKFYNTLLQRLLANKQLPYCVSFLVEPFGIDASMIGGFGVGLDPHVVCEGLRPLQFRRLVYAPHMYKPVTYFFWASASRIMKRHMKVAERFGGIPVYLGEYGDLTFNMGGSASHRLLKKQCKVLKKAGCGYAVYNFSPDVNGKPHWNYENMSLALWNEETSELEEQELYTKGIKPGLALDEHNPSSSPKFTK